MKLTIDNLRGQGPVDYTAAVDLETTPRIVRRINAPSELAIALLAGASAFVVPAVSGRIVMTRADGSVIFTGYLTAGAEQEYLGVGQHGPVVRYHVTAQSDEALLDAKALPDRAPFAGRTAGSALKQLVQDLMPGVFDVSGVQDVDTLASYAVNPEQAFSHHAAEIARAPRASYRAMNGAITLQPVGAATYGLSESDSAFSPEGLTLESPALLLNDLMVVGLDEPQAYVRDYFVGNGLSRQFYLSQKPFAQSRAALIEETFSGAVLDATTWQVSDPSSVVSVAAQTLKIAGGTGQDGQTTVSFVERMELGGAIELQHGDVSFLGPSQGLLGGLYAGGVAAAGCLAGFQVTPVVGNSTIQAVIEGAATGPMITTQSGHRYVLTTYVYSMEVYRSQETYHSSVHPAGAGVGGGAVAADVRFVLEVHDIDPNNPASWIATATVLYDGVVQSAPGFATYALVNAANMQCSVAYTYAAHISTAEVRTAVPSATYATQLVGRLVDGAQCEITSAPSLDFYPQYVPALNQLIVVSYRGLGRAAAHVRNTASVATQQNGSDDGVRGAVRAVKLPAARTATDCENAALAIMDDSVAAAWSGTYLTWSDFLPGGALDIFPGDGLAMNIASRAAAFVAIVRQVEIELADPANDRGVYAIEFANDLAASLAVEYGTGAKTLSLGQLPPLLTTGQVGSHYVLNLTGAQITQVTATTASIDAGITPASGLGIEVRLNDFGWGQANDRNLVGRFSTQTFTVPRLARTQSYFLRLYDNSSPPGYSRYSAALHVDYPL